MATMIEQMCWCGKTFQAREADIKRGWAKACCKSHAAHAREKKLDRFGFQRGESGTFHSCMAERREHAEDAAHRSGMDAVEDGWDGHKNAF